MVVPLRKRFFVYLVGIRIGRKVIFEPTIVTSQDADDFRRSS